ncbi:BTB/POZ protein [Rhizophagus clarus]|uniref:BTB/POZ protein n=1 Tax=Rhizophagus clarus TaxID=94130 RepID=A0A8H3QHI8_9GLOM|nr:BTB/POZ protein [Rhizophagus clarus]
MTCMIIASITCRLYDGNYDVIIQIGEDLDGNVKNLCDLIVAADEINLNELLFEYIYEHITNLSDKNLILWFNDLKNFMYLQEFEEHISKNAFREFLKILIPRIHFLIIWNNLIKWVIEKNTTINSHTFTWKSKEFEIIRNAIQQFIPHISSSTILSRIGLSMVKKGKSLRLQLLMLMITKYFKLSELSILA